MLHLMNAICQTIYKTDWIYFEPDVTCSAELCVTILLCIIVVPILWLLSYSVMRYQNFFLSLLVTFPFVEVGFFFGIVPQHLPIAGLFAFWCGIGAAQLAGSKVFLPNSKAGFVRRRNTFFPVSGMRFLLTESTGIIVAVVVLIITLLCDNILAATQYERPEKVKQMRSSFQEYAASIDWNDLSTVIPPFMRSGSGSHAENTIYLGDVGQRQYQDTTMSKVLFSKPPQGHVYLKFSTYQEYSQNTWNKLPLDSYRDPVFDCFETLDMYPPEFLYYTASQFGGTSIDMTLVNANKVLTQCVPYGFLKNDAIHCIGDDIDSTKIQTYTIYGGMEYESMLLNSKYSMYRADNLMGFTELSHGAILREMSDMETEIFAAMELESYAAEAALASVGDYSDFVQTHYLNVPQSAEMTAIQMQYSDLFEEYDAQSASPVETVLFLQRVRDRLCSQVSYSLSPGKTPQSRDFVSYFLLENKKGYCTHYATAAVLLTRMAGIPARYC
ncbi:MAG: transglutaminase-like domain-containing protein, partial [Oscillospiraceae bacterium]|nr:transglutaminase-like domain-containing protein [Oscillospiraceae bacterium]